MKFARVRPLVLMSLAFGCVPLAHAQAWPAKTVRLILPAPPGSAPDFLSRLMGPKLSELWGQPVVIDNRAGANGVIGTEIAARSPPDGRSD